MCVVSSFLCWGGTGGCVTDGGCLVLCCDALVDGACVSMGRYGWGSFWSGVMPLCLDSESLSQVGSLARKPLPPMRSK